jgi:hypothetical protein
MTPPAGCGDALVSTIGERQPPATIYHGKPRASAKAVNAAKCDAEPCLGDSSWPRDSSEYIESRPFWSIWLPTYASTKHNDEELHI